ncbi:MAG TPA: hypothetical protein VN999_11890 [Thermoanaerobaculia bacterium]|nr:hypothetical protein [Thermoanaerobaculia bacterium]
MPHRQPGLDGRHRDDDGEIHRKRDDTLVGTLRHTYGSHFLSSFRADATLGHVFQITGARSLSDLIQSHDYYNSR